MADWGNVYNFDTEVSDSIRIRRLERGRQTLRGGSVVASSGAYAAIPSDLLDGNNISLASQNLIGIGSVAPIGFKGKFAFSADTTSITVYWDGTNGSEKFIRLGDDGTSTIVTAGSMTVSSLASSTSYGFLPYYSPFNNCGIGWIVGDSGSPKFAFTAAAQTVLAKQQQALRGREPMSSNFITYSTTASGTTTGGGGGGGVCVMLGTDIEPLGDIEYTTEHHPQSEWIHIQADGYPRSLYCTPDHRLYHAVHGKRRADEFVVGDWIITDMGERRVVICEPHRRVCTKVAVHMPHGHLFWANGYLSHNLKPYTDI